MLSEYMLMLKMVNLGVNVDNGSIQVGYTKLAGFDVRKNRKRTHVSWHVCKKEGFWESKCVDKQTGKGSIRVGCKAEVKV
jgi:hypothetical protein